MNEAINRQVRLASRPTGWVTPDHFRFTEEAVPEPAEGQVLVHNLFMSVDPYMRGRMNDVKSYVPPFQVDEVLQAGVVGRVAKSRSAEFAEGDYVQGMLGWENYSLSNGQGLYRISDTGLPLSLHLGVLGMPGMTAFVGLFRIAAAKPGETVFVSAGSGAVGSVAGQLAKLHGCHVTGCAGSDEKVKLMREEFGYDAAFNYRNGKPLSENLQKVAPKGVDVDFENVGGEVFEAVFRNMRPYGRIALCGMVANYNDAEPAAGPPGMMSMIAKRLTIRGFIVTDHADACREYVGKASRWLAEGKLRYRETVTRGLENAPQAFIDMLKGGNIGKQIVQLGE